MNSHNLDIKPEPIDKLLFCSMPYRPKELSAK